MQHKYSYSSLMAIQRESCDNVAPLTGEIIANNLNGVIIRHLAAVILYNAALIVDPVACINGDC